MKSLLIWLRATRPKTLPLALGAILLGSLLAAYVYSFSTPVFLLAIITALLLQIFSNLANDYGDYIKGTDQDAQRTDRALVAGDISPKKMKQALWILGVVSLISGFSLLVVAFKDLNLNFYTWLLIGFTALASARNYTIGKYAYGYKGVGDVMVFVFFGPVAVCGTYFLMVNNLPNSVWLPACGFGFLCVAVLNINNLRDIDTDKKSGKKTIALRLGYKRAIWYQYILFGIAMGLFMAFARVSPPEYDQFIPIIFGAIYYIICFRLEKKPIERATYNLALKQVSILNLLLVIIFGIFWLA